MPSTTPHPCARVVLALALLAAVFAYTGPADLFRQHQGATTVVGVHHDPATTAPYHTQQEAFSGRVGHPVLPGHGPGAATAPTRFALTTVGWVRYVDRTDLTTIGTPAARPNCERAPPAV